MCVCVFQFFRLLSCVQHFVTPWTVAHQVPLSFTTSQSWLKFMSIEPVMLYKHLIICYYLLLCLQSLAISRSSAKSWLFTSSGQNTGASASASVLPMNIQDWFPLGLNGLISLQSKRLSRVFSSTTVEKYQLSSILTLFMGQLSHLYMTTGKTIALTIWTFFDKVMSLLFNMLPRFAIAFLPRSKHLLISRLQSLSIVTYVIPILRMEVCHLIMSPVLSPI